MKLSEHFDLNEFTRSATADRLHIDNSLNPSDPTGQSIINNLRNLCQQVLEPLRQHFGTPVVISSGYRCPALNRAVGGVPNSQHLKGEAADIVPPYNQRQTPYTLKAWFDWLKDHTDFDQLILEHDSKGNYWIHVSCRKNRKANRHQVFYDLKK